MIFILSANTKQPFILILNAMNKVRFALLATAFQFLLSLSLFSSGVGGYAGSNTFEVVGGNSTNPKYQVASASIVGDAVYTGIVDTSDSTTVSFATGIDDNNVTTYPFSSSVFNPNMQIPILTASVSGAVTTISSSYPGGFDGTRTRFTPGSPPELIIDLPSSGDDGASATAVIATSGGDTGKLTGVTSLSGGSGYTDAPTITVVAGPHFLRNTDSSSTYYGRYFLISDNNQTRVTLDLSRVAQSETSYGANTFFPAGTTVEVVPAPTLGSVFGRDTSDLPTNWSYGLSENSDWIYLWDSTVKNYFPFFFLGTTYEASGWPRGWYSSLDYSSGVLSNKVIYPDEAFIVAKRTTGTVSFEFEGTVQTNDQELFLPEGGNQVLMNNPYGTDILLGELIPSTEIGASSSTKFNPGASVSSANTDTISFLQSGGNWLTFYYDSSSASNPGVTAMHVVGTRSPTVRSSASTLASSDVYIGNGTVTGLASCDASGSTGGITGNDANWTKVSISGSSIPTYSSNHGLKGFQVTFADLQGYMLNDAGTSEVNATTTNEVADGSGSVIYSNLIGTHEVVYHGNGFLVVEKQRDVNFKSDEGSPVWNIGSLGAGYTNGQTAKFFCVGGGATTANSAQGTVSTTGTCLVTTAGSGYSAAPQAVVTGGGWRKSGTNDPQGGHAFLASEGVLIYRGYSSGQKTFIASVNPNN